MLKFLYDVVQLLVFLQLTCNIVKWVFFRKKGKNKGIVQKCFLLAKRRINYWLDVKIKAQEVRLDKKAQKESPAPSLDTQEQSSLKKGGKVIPFPQLKQV